MADWFTENRPSAAPASSGQDWFAQKAPAQQTPDPGFFGTLWNDLKQINPTKTGDLAKALFHHPIETIKAAVGTMDLEHPENSTGLLGLPDELYEQWKAGHHGEALAHEAEFAAPVLFKGIGALADTSAGTAAAGFAKGAVKALPGAAETSIARYTGIPQVVRGGIQGARAALTAAPDITGGHDIGFLNDIAGEDFANLSPEKQAGILQIANRLDKPIPPELNRAPVRTRPFERPAIDLEAPQGKTMRDIVQEEIAPPEPFDVGPPPDPFQPAQPKIGGPLRPPLAEPNPAPPAIPTPNAGGGRPIRPPVNLPPAEPPAPPQAIAQKLFEEMRSNGDIPPEAKPGEPIGGSVPVNPEPFVEKARALRGTGAEKLAQAFHDFQIPSTDLSNIDPPQWNAVARSLGVDFPASRAAQLKLIKEVGKALRLKESAALAVGR